MLLPTKDNLRSAWEVNNKRMGDICLDAQRKRRPITVDEDAEFSRLNRENRSIEKQLDDPSYETRVIEHETRDTTDQTTDPKEPIRKEAAGDRLHDLNERMDTIRNKMRTANAEEIRALQNEFLTLEREMGDIQRELRAEQAPFKQRPVAEVLPNRHVNRAFEPWIDQKSGQPIKVLTREERFSDLVQIPHDYEPLSLGKYIKGLATGEWAGASAEHRAMNEGSGGAGQFLVPNPLAANIIDKMRNKSVLFQAGALTVPMGAQTLSIARISADPTPMWHSEAGTITASDMTFERVTFTAQVLAAICQMSIEVFEDCNIDQIASDTLAKVLALELDRAGLRGTGTAPELKGIRFQTGVNIDNTTFTTNGSVISASAPAGAPAHIWLAKMIAAMWAVNENPNAVIWHPRTGGEMDKLVDSTGQPLRELPSESRLVKLQTASIPINLTQGTSNDASEATLGDFSAAMVGMRTNLTLEVSRLGNIGATSLFSTMQVGIRAYLRADFQLARPAAFRVIAGIR